MKGATTMPKHGILNDYDLRANNEDSAEGVTCAICGTENTTFQWSDYNGEAMCTKCGCPYQLINGTDEQKAKADYPYLSLKEEFIPVAQEYWNETHKFTHYGMSISKRPGYNELCVWLDNNHPEWLRSE
jgi:hypothetical protein